ncbi:hypothetical protein QFZ82_004654 [Streptomyces sp. V4I23]|nr:hypothetical protein [Streptomyces sp. V4I23]
MSQEFLQKTINELQAGRNQGLSTIELGKLAEKSLGPAFGPVSFIAAFRGAFGIPLDALQRAHV